MKAEELRIGNVVGSYNTGEEEDFFAITAQNIVVEKKSNKQGYTRYRPIPLTEEWLLKFGFIKGLDYNQWGISCGRIDLFWETYSAITIRYNDEHRNVITISVKYVHQLQNLYHALTGTELELKNAQ